MSLVVRRTARRVAGFLWSLWYGFLAPFHWLRYRTRLLRLGVSDAYIRQAFSFLVQLGIEDYVAGKTEGAPNDLAGLRIVRAAGLELHVQEHTIGVPANVLVYEFVLFQDHTGQLVVHERRDAKRWVHTQWNEFSKCGMTTWWEVFRSGRYAENVRFVSYLKRLYGEGPQDAIQEPSTEAVHVRHQGEESGGTEGVDGPDGARSEDPAR